MIRTENSKRTSADFSRCFDFLTKDYGLKTIMENYSITGGDGYVRVLRNQFVQVELAGDQNYFHAEIRLLVDGQPRPYWDEQNNIGFEDLAILITGHSSDHFDYYSALAGWTKVLENATTLFKQAKELFTTEKWVDTKRMEELKDEVFFKKFGFKPSENKNKPTFFGLVKEHALKLLDEGFKLVFDSSDLPPYNSDSWTPKIVLERRCVRMKISQRDWRDYTSYYYIEINGQEEFEIDLSSQPNIETAAIIFNQQIDKLTS